MLGQVKKYQIKAFDGVNSGIAKVEELHGVAETKINDILVQLAEKLGERGEAIKLDELRARYDEIVANFVVPCQLPQVRPSRHFQLERRHPEAAAS